MTIRRQGGYLNLRRTLRRSSGQAIVEYIIIFPLLLILTMGAIQIALIYQAKFTLNYATFMGARQGALKNANLNAIKDGVAAGLTPLFMRWNGSGAPGLVDLSKARVISTIEVFNPLTAKVEIISPTQAAFSAIAGSGTEIPNDNLMYRSGSGDGMSVQDANLLKVRVTYCVKLVVPFVNRMIYSLVNGINGMQNLATEFFWSPTYTPPPSSALLCNNLSNLYAAARQQVDDITGGSAIPGMSTVQSLANSFINLLPTTFPDAPVPQLEHRRHAHPGHGRGDRANAEPGAVGRPAIDERGDTPLVHPYFSTRVA